jgi:rubrerythrin
MTRCFMCGLTVQDNEPPRTWVCPECAEESYGGRKR